jgi:hypothetical protein
MATALRFFLTPEDELAFFRALAPLRLEVYPRRVPPDWKPFSAGPDTVSQLPDEEAYLVASDIGPALVDRVKRGPDKGYLRIDEVRSPVIFYERCRQNEEGELVSGKCWAESEVTPQTGRRDAAPERFRQLVAEVEGYFRRVCRKGEPKGFFIGPHAARQFKEGLVLRDSDHRGGTVRPYK